jgi:hypothetical protein
LKIVRDFSERKNEARWKANALILLARIRNKQKEFRDALEELLPEAIYEAQKVNDRPNRSDKAVNSERNKGWIFLNFALTHLQDGNLASSKSYLDKWRELRGIRYRWLIDFAAAIEAEHAAAQSDFVIRRDVDNLSWKNHMSELVCWLIEMAKLRTHSDKREILAKELDITPKTLGELRKLAEQRMKNDDS